MNGSGISAVFYGLASAACWSTSDFSGGIATRKNSVFSVIMFSQIAGVIPLAILALLLAIPLPPAMDIITAMSAGLVGATSLTALYSSLSRGHMGIVAPIAGLVGVIVPIVAGTLVEGLPAPAQMAGFAAAMTSVWFITHSSQEGEGKLDKIQLLLPVIAGVCAGSFFVLIDRLERESLLWSLSFARFSSISALFLISLALKRFKIPGKKTIPLIILIGIMDTCGNGFFALATNSGRVDIASVLASLSPAGTVVLSWLIMKEKMTTRKAAGVLTAMTAIVLMSL